MNNKVEKEDKIFHLADTITKYNFEQIWSVEGTAIEKLTKQEIAEEMFFKGIAYTLDHLETLEEIDLNKTKRKLEENIKLTRTL